jgi:3-deoxy-7-phosphoheptulonate synthase
MDTDIQLASRNYIQSGREIQMGNIRIGGSHHNTVVMAGPCAVESEEQIDASSALMVELGISVLRAGCFKPRTSPYSFQGLGLEGLKLLSKMRNKYGLIIITEVRDASHVDDVIAYADIIQIGAKSMYDHGILRKCGKAHKPVLLKRIHFIRRKPGCYAMRARDQDFRNKDQVYTRPLWSFILKRIY